MKADPTNMLVAMLTSALLAFGIWSLDANTLKTSSAIGSFIFLACTLACSVGLRFGDSRVGASLKILGFISFVVALGLNISLVLIGVSQATYIIASGIGFLLFVLLANGVSSAKQF